MIDSVKISIAGREEEERKRKNGWFVKIADIDEKKYLAIDATEAMKLKPVDAEGKFWVDEGKYRWVIVPECGEVEEVDARTAAKIATAARHSVLFYTMAIMAADDISDDDKIIAVFDLEDEESGIATYTVEDDADFGPGVWLGLVRLRNKHTNETTMRRAIAIHPVTMDGKKCLVLRGYDLYAIGKAMGVLNYLRLCKEGE